MSEEKKLSPVEGFKRESHYLAGTIAEELADPAVDHFGKANEQLIKNHGFYQQDDRDFRKSARGEGKAAKAYIYMIRTRIPGGKLTPEQMLAELDLCDELGNSTLRITSRQGLQLHGVLRENLRSTIRRINEVQLTTLAACGDVNRNVMCCPAPHDGDLVHAQMQEAADKLAAHFKPRTRAYHEIWLKDTDTGEDTLVAGGSNGQEIEPIYGVVYLPRKFKMAIGLPGDNCVDLYANDLAFMAITENGQIAGYNVLVGGGMGTTPSAAKCFPACAHKMTYIRADQLLDVATAIVKVQRDFGNREDRKQARMKYLIHNWGLPKFKAKVEEYYGQPLPEPRADDVHHVDDHLGWREQGQGKWFYGLNVENGRIKDDEAFRLKAALRQICHELKPAIRLTAEQSILFCDLTADAKPKLESILRAHGVKLSEETSLIRRRSMACVAWPTCGLSITEAERALPGLMDQLEVEMARLGLSSESIIVHMTGCPNGCARPYNSEIGLVGKAAGKYTLFLGGSHLGHRLNFVYKDSVPENEVVSTLTPVLALFKGNRNPGEAFGDFCQRLGVEGLTSATEQAVAS